jgi:hypothetical protein
LSSIELVLQPSVGLSFYTGIHAEHTFGQLSFPSKKRCASHPGILQTKKKYFGFSIFPKRSKIFAGNGLVDIVLVGPERRARTRHTGRHDYVDDIFTS